MTGFVAIQGGIQHLRALDRLVARIQPDGSRLQVVFSDNGLAIYCTGDLPSLDNGRIVAVGEVSLADPTAMTRTLDQQRRLGLAALVSAYDDKLGVPAGFAEDYNFLIWDRELKRLISGRDGLGVRPLFYASSETHLIVGSAIRFVIGAGSSEAIDPGSLVRFIAGRPARTVHTCILGVMRLPPGARLSKTDAAPVLVTACEPPLPPPKPWPGGDPVEAFAQAFSAAVCKRLARSEETTSFLSGGLDSSSIAIVATDACRSRNLPPPSMLSLVFDKLPQWSERPYIEAVLQARGLTGRFVEASRVDPLSGVSAQLAEQGGPFAAPGLSLGRRLYTEAAQAGGAVLLDGHGGDEVVSYGWGRLHTLARDQTWAALWTMIKGVARGSDDKPALLFSLYWLKHGPGRRWMSRAVRLRRKLSRGRPQAALSDAGLRLVSPSWRGQITSDPTSLHSPVDSGSSEAGLHYATLTSETQAMALETLHATASAAGVAARYPFWDRELIALCLSLPEEAKLDSEGLARWVLRQAVDLPPMVKQRWDKLDFSPHVALGLLQHNLKWLEDLVERRSDAPIWGYAHRPAVRAALRELVRRREKTSGSITQSLWRVAVATIWLDERAARGLYDPAAT